MVGFLVSNGPLVERKVFHVPKHLCILLALIIFRDFPAAADGISSDVGIHQLPLLSHVDAEVFPWTV